MSGSIDHDIAGAADSRGDQRGSAVVAAIEQLYAAIQLRHPELPDVVVVTGSGFSARKQTWGHFRRDAWREAAAADEAGEELPVNRRPELFIAGETLAQGTLHTLVVLLHEAAHGLAAVRGVDDTSKEGRYHNRRFVALAEELGLRHPTGKPHPIHGLTAVVLDDDTAYAYADEVAELEEEVTLYLDTLERLGLRPGGGGDGRPDGTEGEGGPRDQNGRKGVSNRNNLKAICSCGRVIRASRRVLEGPKIICAGCGGAFVSEAGARGISGPECAVEESGLGVLDAELGVAIPRVRLSAAHETGEPAASDRL